MGRKSQLQRDLENILKDASSDLIKNPTVQLVLLELGLFALEDITKEDKEEVISPTFAEHVMGQFERTLGQLIPGYALLKPDIMGGLPTSRLKWLQLAVGIAIPLSALGGQNLLSLFKLGIGAKTLS